MDQKNYCEFLQAKQLIKERDFFSAIKILRKLDELEVNNLIIKFELARLLIQNKNTVIEGKNILLNLLSSSNRTYAMFELGKLSVKEGKLSEARKYFEQLLNAQNRTYAMLELGRLSVKEGKLSEAREYFKQLLNTSNRTYAMLELGRLSVKEGKLSEAREYFEQLLNAQNRTYAIQELIYLNIREGKFLEALKLFEESNEELLNSIDYDKIKIYLKYMLGLYIDNQENNSYFGQQLFHYNEQLAINHIKKHLYEINDKKTHNVFNEEINIEQLFYQVKEIIKDMEPFDRALVEKYVVSFDYDIALINGEKTKSIEVVTFPNSNNILTIFPILFMIDQKTDIKMKKT